MAKQTGLGDNFYIDGVDLSGDIQALSSIHGGPAALDMTGINQSGVARQGGKRDGGIDFTAYFNPGAGLTHAKLSALPTADVIASYFRGTAVGNDAASQVSRQINYDPARGADGSLIFGVQAQADGFGLEWGTQLTAGTFAASSFLTGDASGFEGGIANWTSGGNDSIAQTAAQAHGGTKSLALTSTAGGSMFAAHCTGGNILTQGLAVVPGQQVIVQAWFRAAVSPRTCQPGISWFDSGGAQVGGNVFAAGAADSTSAWTLASGTFVAPAGAVWCRAFLQVAATGAGAEVHYVDDVTLTAAPVSFDTGGSLAFGAQAYLHVFSFTGTDATIKIQDSADNVTFADVAGLTFAQITTAPGAQRLAIGNTATVRRYVAATVVTTGGFTALAFAVALTKNQIAGQVF